MSARRLVGLLVPALCLAATPARAGQRVFLTRFGAEEEAAAIRTAVKGMLEQRGYEVLENEKLELGPASPPKELADLARKFVADGAVTGGLAENERKHFVLTIAVVST